MESISLIGFMGSGKSSVGKELSKLLPDMEFIDLDSYIEAMTGRTIPEIFDTDGESAFRELERTALKNIFMTGDLTESSFILSLGGGTVMTEACRRMIRRKTKCFYLHASTDTLVSNLEQWPGERPMLKSGKDLRDRVEELMESRGPVYKKTAHHIIDVDGNEYLAAALKILNCLEI